MDYSSFWVNRFRSFVLIIFTLIIYAQSDVPRPRGVSLFKASLYSPTKDFTCFDGTVTIPFTYVNDDYCDCFDGSDEPGTSACLNGVFHCTNAGHRPENIPSSRVNDGVCDCCDGTDEYTDPDICPNTCEEMGKEARAEAQRLADLHKAGNHLRLELIEKGNKKRNEMAEQLSQLEKDKAEAQKIKAEKESLKNQLETKENEVLQVYRDVEERERQKKIEEEKEAVIKDASQYFDMFDSNEDNILTVGEAKGINSFDKNEDGEVDQEEIQYFLGPSESVDKDTFVTTTWALLKPFVMLERGIVPTEGNEEGDDHDADETRGDLETDEGDTDEENADEELSHGADQDIETEPTQTYDEETQKIVDEATDARRQWTDAERHVREIESNIRIFQQNLEKDYGPQQEYATLDGQCLEHEDKEYVYKLCLFQKVTQKSKNGGAEVGLGNWGEWAGEDNKYSVMKYTNGIACWNGPSRTTSVNVHCGLETKMLSVTEPYALEVQHRTCNACCL